MIEDSDNPQNWNTGNANLNWKVGIGEKKLLFDQKAVFNLSPPQRLGERQRTRTGCARDHGKGEESFLPPSQRSARSPLSSPVLQYTYCSPLTPGNLCRRQVDRFLTVLTEDWLTGRTRLPLISLFYSHDESVLAPCYYIFRRLCLRNRNRT